MKANLNTLSKNLYDLSNLERFQTSPRIHRETVLEHLAVTTMIVHKLRDDYIFNELRASRLAIFHDYPEHLLSDIPHPCKKRLPKEFVEMIEDLEIKVIKEDIDDDTAELLDEFNKKSSVEGLIVALADAYSVILFCFEYRQHLISQDSVVSVVTRPRAGDFRV